MNRLLHILLLSLLSLLSFGQETENYVQTSVRGNDGRMHVSYQYVDGRGNPYLRADIGASPGGGNLVTLTETNAFGLQTRRWKTIPSASAFLGRADVQDAARNYYSDHAPYSETTYEASPLHRVTAEAGEGIVWNSHPKRIERHINTEEWPLNCRYYSVSPDGHLEDEGYFAARTLSVTKRIDEDHHAVYEFFNLRGHKILERRQKDSKTSADIYFVYDLADNLTYVLQPEYQQTEDVAQHAFHYTYDHLHQLISSRWPGCEAIRYAYDDGGRQIFSQDGVQRQQGLMTFMLYDNLGRQVVKGTCRGTTLPNLQDVFVETSFSETTDGLDHSGYTTTLCMTDAKVDIVTYYDDYRFLSLNGFADKGFEAGKVNAKGQATGMRISTLGSIRKDLYRVSHYDIRERCTKMQSTNLMGGMENAVISYGYTQPKTITHRYSIANQKDLTLQYAFNYDNNDRPTTTTLQIDDNNSITLIANDYDATGRLSARQLMEGESTAYQYNIRDWPTSISSANFKEELTYYGTPKQNYFNGNIAWMRWQTGETAPIRHYLYEYDNLNRLVKASYGEGGPLDKADHYSTSYAYDLNGNATRVKRNGRQDDGSFGLIDDITYVLEGNQLLRATDDAVGPLRAGAFHFVDGADENVEYEYDANGNQTKDLNRGITAITYNTLNLPEQIIFCNGGITNYIYDATGRKLRATYQMPDGTNHVTDYCDSIIYEDGVRSRLLVDGGYITFDGDTPQYHYYLKDHQGNNRVVVETRSGRQEQVNHYYPYGGLMAESTGGEVNRYKYNGKELDRMHGLDWMDYGARWMDGMRFTTPDPLAGKYPSISPYAYCADNPVRYVDPDGRKIQIPVIKDRSVILGYINSLSKYQFSIDNKGYLYGNDKMNEKGSTTYGERICDAINENSRLITIDIADIYIENGSGENISSKGEGVTFYVAGNEVGVSISNREYVVKDADNKDMVQHPADILMHELIGHAIPKIAKSDKDTGNAIKNENIIRQELQINKRKENKDHVE